MGTMDNDLGGSSGTPSAKAVSYLTLPTGSSASPRWCPRKCPQPQRASWPSSPKLSKLYRTHPQLGSWHALELEAHPMVSSCDAGSNHSVTQPPWTENVGQNGTEWRQPHEILGTTPQQQLQTHSHWNHNSAVFTRSTCKISIHAELTQILN